MASRPTIIILSFLAGAAIFALAPGLSTTVQRAIGIGQQNKTANSAKQATPEPAAGALPIRLRAGIAMRLTNPDKHDVVPYLNIGSSF